MSVIASLQLMIRELSSGYSISLEQRYVEEDVATVRCIPIFIVSHETMCTCVPLVHGQREVFCALFL